jgi:hypothetical protein
VCMFEQVLKNGVQFRNFSDNAHIILSAGHR